MSETKIVAKRSNARRNFIIGASAVTTGAAVAVLATDTAKKRVVGTSKPSVPQGEGYQLTEHVRNYYRTTSV